MRASSWRAAMRIACAARELVALLGLLLASFLAATAFGANPFAHVGRSPSDGRGLNPLLRNPAMAVQPPLLMLGVAGATVPVAMLLRLR